MQWKRRKRTILVIGSANHPLLLRHYKLIQNNHQNDHSHLLHLHLKSSSSSISDAGPESNTASSSIASPPAEDQDSLLVTSSPEHRVTFNEDEYTKITTPRQDVLFKKGYLGRRRTNNPTSDAQELHNADSVESGEYVPEEPAQFTYIPPTGFIDHTGVLYVNSGTYELYDPYSGNLAVVVGPAPQYPPQPVLAAMPCQPVPLNPLEWFNPSAPWTYPYNDRRKRYSTDSQNCSAQSSESTGPPGSPQEPIDDGVAGAMFPPQPPPYIYPGYMFGAPVYNMNGVNVQGVVPQPAQVPLQPTMPDMLGSPNTTTTAATTPTNTSTTKRRKKRKRRRRGGVTDEGSESSCEDVIGCDVGVCSQSGASSDAGPGSSCSKTNSDSGINTEPTPDSGSNTPPLLPQLTAVAATAQIPFHESTNENDHCMVSQNLQQQLSSELDVEAETEPISSSVSTPEAHKCTFESLPSEDGETLQELSCSSELNGEPKVLNSSSSELNSSFKEEVMNNETTVPDSIDICNSTFQEDNNVVTPDNTETDNVTIEGCEDLDLVKSNNQTPVSIVDSSRSDKQNESDEQVSYPSRSNDSPATDNFSSGEEGRTDHCNNKKTMSPFKSLSMEREFSTNADENTVEVSDIEEKITVEITDVNSIDAKAEQERVSIPEVNLKEEGKESILYTCNHIPDKITQNPNCQDMKPIISNERLGKNVSKNEPEERHVIDKISSQISPDAVANMHVGVDYFSSSQERQAPVPPPRKRRSLYRAAEKVAKKVVDEAIENGIKEVARTKCQCTLPITEAVTRWLQSQGSVVLSPADDSDEEEERYEEDEGIEEGEGSSTNQKNVEGNPFLVPYLSGSRQRVADSDECGSQVSSAGEWDMYDHESHTRAICDPVTTVDKYYRLGAEDFEEKMASASHHSMIKTAVHIRRAGPFPCGVCCIIQ